MAWDGSAPWVAQQPDFLRLDSTSGATLRTIPIPGARGVNGLVWGSSSLLGFRNIVRGVSVVEVYKVDPTSGALGSAAEVSPPSFAATSGYSCNSMAWDGGSIWLSCNSPGTVGWIGRVAGNTFAETRILSPVTTAYTGLAYIGGGFYAYNITARGIHRINPSAGSVFYSNTLPNPSLMVGGAYDGSGFWSIDVTTNILHKLQAP